MHAKHSDRLTPMYSGRLTPMHSGQLTCSLGSGLLTVSAIITFIYSNISHRLSIVSYFTILSLALVRDGDIDRALRLLVGLVGFLAFHEFSKGGKGGSLSARIFLGA
jgi:hypothetical protein